MQPTHNGQADIKERLKLKATVEGSITETTMAVAVGAVVAVEQQ